MLRQMQPGRSDMGRQGALLSRALTAYVWSDALEAYKCAAQLSLEENSFSMAAHHYKSMGEICEDEELDIEQTIEAYSKAADCFETADSPKNAIEMTMKVAFFNAKIEQYDRAIEAYKKVVEGSTKGLDCTM